MSTTIHSSHITRWRFQSCDRKVRPLGDIKSRAQRLSIKIQLLISIFSSATRATVWRSLTWNATERATKLSSTSIASTTFSYRWSSDIFKKHFLSLKWPWVRSSASNIVEFDWEMTHLILNSWSRVRRWCWRNAKRRWLEEPTSCQPPHWAIQGGGCIIIKSVAGKKNSRLYRMSQKSDYWWLSPCTLTTAAL